MNNIWIFIIIKYAIVIDMENIHETYWITGD